MHQILNRRIVLLCVWMFTFLLVGGTAQGGAIAFNTADVRVCDPIQCAFQQSSGATVSFTTTLGPTASGAEITGTGTATSTYGVLRAFASNSIDNIGPGSSMTWEQVDAYFEDVITINFAPLTGQPGLLFPTYTLDGTISSSGIDNAFANVQVATQGLSSNFFGYNSTAVYTASTSGSFSPAPIPFVYGTPFGLYFHLYLYSGTVSPNPGGGFVLSSIEGTGNASADFSNTLILSGLIATDSLDNPVEATFSSASGTNYGVDGVLPEPSPACLFGIGLLTLLVVRRLKHYLGRQCR